MPLVLPGSGWNFPSRRPDRRETRGAGSEMWPLDSSLPAPRGSLCRFIAASLAESLGRRTANIARCVVVAETPRQLPRADYLALKAATRALVETAGGARSAASRVRDGIDAARLSRYGSPHEPLFMPLDIIADLEAETGEPAIARALAELAGCDLVRRATAAPRGQIAQNFAAIAAEAGDVFKVTGAALGDGAITAAEARTMRHEGIELARAVAQFLADVDALLRGGAPAPRATAPPD